MAEEERKSTGIAWEHNGEVPTLLCNITVPFVKKNVDIVLLDSAVSEAKQKSLTDPSRYIALGELKGGIDPAGADEHWKTAVSALVRIRQAFSDHSFTPKTFFAGAAIEKAMAQENGVICSLEHSQTQPT